MLFNSWQFLLFFPVVVTTYFVLPHRARWAWLLAASCVFYAAFVPQYLLILFAVIGIDYAAGLLIARSEGAARRRWLLMSVVANLSMLGFFKYFNFFADNAKALAGMIGWNLPLPILQVVLPIGLSFHVFQSLAYVIEVYRGNQAPERHLGLYALYVMFWPQLVAGPIERPQHVLHQFREVHAFDYERVTNGLRRMAWGLVKKVVIADRLAPLVDRVFDHPGDAAGVAVAIAAVFFAIQIYCDFSGYSDVALGSAEVMGFRLMENFKRPYFSTSVQEFWTRWHVSLSTWFRDYLYVPLGGNRVARPRWIMNVLVVFLVSGLWHGANWTYVAWGALHGIYLAMGALTAGLRQRAYAALGLLRWPRALAGGQWLATFALVTFAWVLFRARSIAEAGTLLAAVPTGLLHQLTDRAALRESLLVFGPPTYGVLLPAVLVASLLALEAVQARIDVRAWLARSPAPLRFAADQAALLAIALLGVFDERAFIYFQF